MAEPLLCYGHVHDIYEIDARMIGCWIDGKPIYRKVIPFTITAADMQIDTGVADIEQVVRLDGVIKYLNDGFRTIPWAYTQGTTTDVKYYIGAHLRIVTTPDCKIQILSGSYYNGMSGYMILEYTLKAPAPEPPVPAGYQVVEYIQNTGWGSGYVEVPYTPDIGDDLYVKAMMLAGNATPFSCGTTDVMLQISSVTAVMRVKNMSQYHKDFTTVPTTWCWYYMMSDGSYGYRDVQTEQGESYTFSRASAPADTVFWLLKGRTTASSAATRVADVIITRSGEELIHLIPCYRKSDGANGFYDTVGKVFYAGTGNLTRGADVTE